MPRNIDIEGPGRTSTREKSIEYSKGKRRGDALDHDRAEDQDGTDEDVWNQDVEDSEAVHK